MKVNINDVVRVRLTDDGRRVHRSMHDHIANELKRRGGPDFPYTPIKEEDGWSKWQFWQLMQQFGPVMHNGQERLPFEADFEIVLKQ